MEPRRVFLDPKEMPTAYYNIQPIFLTPSIHRSIPAQDSRSDRRISPPSFPWS